MGLADSGDNPSDALTLFCSAGDATGATVEVTSTALVLIITGGDDAGTTTLALADAANDTLAKIVDVINATDGWTATRIGPASEASSKLIQRAAVNALGSANTITLSYENDTLIEELIDRATDKVEAHLGRKIMSREYREWHATSDGEPVRLRQWPVTAVKRVATGNAAAFTVQANDATDLRATVEIRTDSIILARHDSSGTETETSLAFTSYPTAALLVDQINATTGWTATLRTNCLSVDFHRQGGSDALGRDVTVGFPDESCYDYRVEERTGFLHFSVSRQWDEQWEPGDYGTVAVASGQMSVLVQYTGGYATAPDAIEQVTIELVKRSMDARDANMNMKAESLGDYSYTLMDAVDLDERLAGKLAQWRELR